MAPTTRNVSGSCCVCNGKIGKYEESIKCSKCALSFHLNCTKLCVDDFQSMNVNDTLKLWQCTECEPADPGDEPLLHGESSDTTASVEEASVLLGRILTKIESLKSKCSCKCSNLLTTLLEENKKLRDDISMQNDVIAKMRVEFLAQFENLSLRFSHRGAESSGGGLPVNDVEDGSKVRKSKSKKQSNSCLNDDVPTSLGEIVNLEAPTKQYRRHDLPREPAEKSEFTLSQVGRAVNDAVAVTSGKGRPLLDSENSWQVARKRRQWRKPPLIGSNDTSTLKSVQKLGYLHVYRLDRDTTADELKVFLVHSAPDIDFCCKALNKTEKSASFIVTFPIRHVDRVYSAALWPAGAHVNRYFFPRKPRSKDNSGSTSNFSPAASQTQAG